MKRFRYEYGASPVHLLVALLSFAISAWALAQVLDVLSTPGKFLVWFLGAIVLHDFVFLPLYSLLGLGAAGALTRGDQPSRLRIAALNHLRIPVLLSGLMLLVWYPLVLSRAPGGFERTTGFSADVYLERWLLFTAVLFAGSAILLAARARRLSSGGTLTP
jgi:hypothetical protein